MTHRARPVPCCAGVGYLVRIRQNGIEPRDPDWMIYTVIPAHRNITVFIGDLVSKEAVCCVGGKVKH